MALKRILDMAGCFFEFRGKGIRKTEVSFQKKLTFYETPPVFRGSIEKYCLLGGLTLVFLGCQVKFGRNNRSVLRKRLNIFPKNHEEVNVKKDLAFSFQGLIRSKRIVFFRFGLFSDRLSFLQTGSFHNALLKVLSTFLQII